MDLYIRTQDKKRLLKIDDIRVVDYNGYYYVVGYKNSNEIKLGKYEFHSATRALEILDEIQKYLTPTIQMLDETIGNKEVCQIGTIMTIVFEMPLD